jgi:anti-anti-sigma factor
MKTTFESSYFAVRVSRGSSAVIEVMGELDLSAVPTFEAAVGSLDLASVPRTVLDLRRLDFIDAAGLHAVLDLHAACMEMSSPLAITPGPRHVQRIFRLAAVDHLLRFDPRVTVEQDKTGEDDQ